MTRFASALIGVLLAGAVAWWLLPDDELPAAPEGGDISPALVDGDAGLAGRERPEDESEGEAANPYADVDDVRILARFLGDRERTEQARGRLLDWIAGDAERLRELLRALHPAAANGTLANYYTKNAMTKLVLAIGDPALDVLLAELDDANATWRTYMDALIGSFGRAAARAVPRLVRQLADVPEDPPAAEAASVVYALGAIGPAANEVLPDLHRWLDEGVTEHLEVASAHALVQIGGPTEDTFERCREVLREENWSKQRGAILAQLGALGEGARPMIPYLLELVAEGVIDEYSVLFALGTMGVPDERVLEYMGKRFLLDDSPERAVGAYGGTLVRLGDEGLARFFELCSQRGGLYLAHAPVAFQPHAWKHPPWERILAAIEPALTSEDAAVRLAALRALSHRTDQPVARYAPVVVRGLADPSAEVRETCAWIAAALKAVPKDLARALLERVRDPEEKIDTALACAQALNQHKRWKNEPLFNALLALQRANPRNAEVLFRLAEHAPTHPEVVLRLIDEAVQAGTTTWNWYVGVLRELPARVLEPYPEAREAVEEMRKR